MSLNEQFIEAVEICKRARYPYIWMVSQEETRTLEMISTVATKNNLKCYVWDDIVLWKKSSSWLVDTIEDYSELPDILTGVESLLSSFQSLLDYDVDENGEAIFVYPDFHLEFTQMNPGPLTIIRNLKWISARLAEKGLLVIFLTHSRTIPDELKDYMHVEEVQRPKLEELLEQFDKLLTNQAQMTSVNDNIKEQVARAALGLSRNQADRLYAQAIVKNPQNPEKWVDIVTHGKKGIIGSIEALDYYSPDDLKDDLAGLSVLKDWLNLRQKAYTKEAEEYGLPNPKGVSLIGIPGTGKSLTAKFIAANWHLPLIRFDIGAVFGSYVGQSEETMRNALNIAETIAPCILWIDEIEKAFPKDSGGGDSGTSTRVLASFLTWMQEKKAPVFVIATANDVKKLPPELLRKGRFDEVFFLDVPTQEERADIFKVHIERVGREPRDFDIRRFAKKTNNFVGAEIEEIVKSALYRSFADGEREPTDTDIIYAIEHTYPLYESRRDDLGEIQNMVKRKEVVNASEKSKISKKTETPAQKPKLDI